LFIKPCWIYLIILEHINTLICPNCFRLIIRSIYSGSMFIVSQIDKSAFGSRAFTDYYFMEYNFGVCLFVPCTRCRLLYLYNRTIIEFTLVLVYNCEWITNHKSVILADNLILAKWISVTLLRRFVRNIWNFLWVDSIYYRLCVKYVNYYFDYIIVETFRCRRITIILLSFNYIVRNDDQIAYK